ncbi:MAG: flagellar basal-body rod modification protein FlgD [Planctomycetota bacterium]|jgi:flagellar basal-body rod modification protein FlgD
MNVTEATSSNPYGTSGLPQNEELDKDAFMQLLVSQLRNQDPMNPQSNEDFIAQLAQFSSLEEMENLNDSFLGMAVLQQSNALMSQLTEGSALIGQDVSYIDPATQEQLSGTVESLRIEDGIAVLNVDGKSIPLLSVVEVTGVNDGSDGAEGDGSEDEDEGEDQ